MFTKWTGSISFGLTNSHVKLFSAVQELRGDERAEVMI